MLIPTTVTVNPQAVMQHNCIMKIITSALSEDKLCHQIKGLLRLQGSMESRGKAALGLALSHGKTKEWADAFIQRCGQGEGGRP